MKAPVVAGVLLMIALGIMKIQSRNAFVDLVDQIESSDPVSTEPQVPQLPDFVDYHQEIHPLFSHACTSCHQLSQLQSSELWVGLTTFCHATLVPEERKTIEQWQNEGAFIPVEEFETTCAADKPKAVHWAFQPLRQVPVPANEEEHPIDAFLLQRLQQADIERAPVAMSSILARRLTFALTGLPPTPAQRRVWKELQGDVTGYVDYLINQPAYGEHWARHWLDLARYADTNGYEDDGLKPFAWKYRDFVIRAFNEDLPYHEFVRAQIAGDLQPSPSDDDFIAAGFLRLGPWDSEAEDALQAHFDQIDEMVSTVSSVFMGLTIGCARCHDHPEEPWTARDYARLAACFHGLYRSTNGRLETPVPSATTDMMQASRNNQAMMRRLQRQAAQENNANRASQLFKQAAELEDRFRFDSAYRFLETKTSSAPTRVLHRGNPHQPREYVDAGIPTIWGAAAFGTQRLPRVQLTDWLLNEQPGLLARVFVNRVWGWHFGRGLVETPSQFGPSGPAPTHPELLEWLAHWFVVEANWSIKRLQRLILTSHTYLAQASEDLAQQSLYGAFAPRRLRAEEIYDSLLSLAGCDLENRYGSSDYPKLPKERLATLIEKGAWERPSSVRRRAIYLVVQRNVPVPFLSEFGFPESSQPCSIRNHHHTSSQALTMWNGEFIDECAQAFAERILAESPGQIEEEVETAFQWSLGRSPDQFELESIQRFLILESAAADGDSRLKALKKLSLVLFNLHEFVVLN